MLQMNLLHKNATRTSLLPEVSLSRHNYSKENDRSKLLALRKCSLIDFLFYRQFWCCVVLCGDVYLPVQMKGCNFRGVAFEIREVEVIR